MELRKLFIIVSCCICNFCLPVAGFTAQAPIVPVDPMQKSQGKDQPPVKMVKPGVFEVGGCTIIKEHNRVEFPATINMKEGMLEYVLVGSAGKLHESLLQTQIEPYALQIAILLTGLEGSTKPLAAQGQTAKPEGDLINIWLSWDENGQGKKIPIEECVLVNQKPISDIPWVYTGSFIVDGVFMAQGEKSIVAVYHDPAALIDHQLESGANDEVWTVNSIAVPEIGTNVKVIIEKK